MALILHGEIAMGFTLNSTSFNNNQPIPDVFTCLGKDQIPQLSWTDPPKGTKTYALIVEDPDATSGIWVHWVAFNIPANLTEWPTHDVHAEIVNATNSWGKTGYGGPCPPAGKVHHYIFTLYALDKSLDLSSKATAQDVKQAIAHHILSKTELVGTYQRR